jgi:pimeloyl-ACP methyl ester carboxylesterase
VSSLEHHEADVGEVRLHYVTAGAGEPVVLLHGWPQTWYEWRDVIPLLADRYRVIAPDLRGLGDSSRPPAGYDKRTVAADVWRLVHDKLGHDRFCVVGHDWGVVVAYGPTVAHPDAVRRLFLVDGLIPLEHPDYGLRFHATGWHMMFHSIPELPDALVAGRERLYLSWFYRNLGHPSHSFTAEAIDEYVRTYSQPGALHAGFQYYATLPEDIAYYTELARTMPRLTMPIFALRSTGPFGGKPSSYAAHLPARSDDRSTVVEVLRHVADDVDGAALHGSGHWIPEEQPSALGRYLADFFAG